MSPDCEHCDEHGTNTANIEWTKKKMDKLCEKQEALEMAINDRVPEGKFRWVIGGALAGALAFCLAVFGLYDKVDTVGRTLSVEVSRTSDILGKSVTETRIDTLNKLTDLKIAQHKTSARVEDFGQRLEGLAQNQKILMKQVGEHFDE